MAADNCANCKKQIGCGCQKTKASNGKNIHKGCKAAYEAGLLAGTIK